MFSLKQVVVSVLFLGIVASAVAQPQSPESIPTAEAAFGYSYMRANAGPGTCGCFNLNGGNAELAVRVYKSLSAVFDLTGGHAGATSIPGQSLSLLSYTAGPRFTFPLHRSERVRMLPFAQVLLGGVHGFDGQFADHSSISASANGFALLAGGGVDLELKHRLALRLAQVDYALNRLPNNTNDRENLLRVSVGVVLRFR